MKIIFTIFFSCTCGLLLGQEVISKGSSFSWPNDRLGAISLTFDDADFSQVDSLMSLLDQFGVKASFYISIWSSLQRLEAWRKAIREGHEIGNHTFRHPCTANYGRSIERSLEHYSLHKMQRDIEMADSAVMTNYGLRPITFAYPCGQKFVGFGLETKSYVPLVAHRFLAGRSYGDEGANDPHRCDLAKVLGISMDNASLSDLKEKVDQAMAKGHWLVLVGHKIGHAGPLTTDLRVLEGLLQYLRSQPLRIWIAPVRDVAKYIDSNR